MTEVFDWNLPPKSLILNVSLLFFQITSDLVGFWVNTDTYMEYNTMDSFEFLDSVNAFVKGPKTMCCQW